MTDTADQIDHEMLFINGDSLPHFPDQLPDFAVNDNLFERGPLCLVQPANSRPEVRPRHRGHGSEQELTWIVVDAGSISRDAQPEPSNHRHRSIMMCHLSGSAGQEHLLQRPVVNLPRHHVRRGGLGTVDDRSSGLRELRHCETREVIRVDDRHGARQ